MKLSLKALAAIAVLATAGAATAQPTDITTETAAPEPVQTARSAVADDDLGEAPKVKAFDPTRMLCRRVRPKTGTRIARGPASERMCLTAEEWDRRAEVAQEVLEARDRGTCGSTGCGLPGQ